MFKNVYLIMMCLLMTGVLSAQKVYTKKFSRASGDKKVEVHFFDADVSIEGISGNEVQVKSTGLEPLPERAQGLRPLKSGGTDNTGQGWEVKESNNKIIIRQISRSYLVCNIKVPRLANLTIEESQTNSDHIKIAKVHGELEVNSNVANIDIKGAKGPIVAKSTSGDINIVFQEFSPRGPSSIIATSGFVDVSIPANAKVSLRLETVSGEFFTDFDVDVMTEDHKPTDRKRQQSCGCKEEKITGKINGGGAELHLKALRDNIYLRKS